MTTTTRTARIWTRDEDAALLLEYRKTPTWQLCERWSRSEDAVRARYYLLKRQEASGTDPRLVKFIRANWRRGAAWIADRWGIGIPDVMDAASRLNGLQGHTAGICLAESMERAGRVADLEAMPELPEGAWKAMVEDVVPSGDEAALTEIIYLRAAALRGPERLAPPPAPPPDDVFTRGAAALAKVFGPARGRGGRREKHGPRMTVVGERQRKEGAQ